MRFPVGPRQLRRRLENGETVDFIAYSDSGYDMARIVLELVPLENAVVPVQRAYVNGFDIVDDPKINKPLAGTTARWPLKDHELWAIIGGVTFDTLRESVRKAEERRRHQ